MDLDDDFSEAPAVDVFKSKAPTAQEAAAFFGRSLKKQAGASRKTAIRIEPWIEK